MCVSAPVFHDDESTVHLTLFFFFPSRYLLRYVSEICWEREMCAEENKCCICKHNHILIRENVDCIR